MADDKSVVGTFFCALLLGIGGSIFLWIKFANDLSFYKGQHPAMCVDGRRMGESLMASRVGVDDSERNRGTVTMKCSFPVAVYPCYDDDIEPSEWKGNCRTLASHTAFPEGEWPRREDEPGIACCEKDCLGGDRCSDMSWSCSAGSCDAYEKSTRLCAAKMRSEPYACFTHEEDAGAGVRDESSSFPVGWLIGSICATLVTLCCCCACLMGVSEEEDCVRKTLVYLGVIACCSGFTVVIVIIIKAATGEPDNRGLVDSNYADLAVTMGENTTVLAAEAPPPEGMHWAWVVLIVFGSICGLGVLCMGCLFGLAIFKELGWSARAKACQQPSAGGADVEKQQSTPSVFSGKSNRSLASSKSREEINNLVKTTSGISKAEVMGHQFLNQAEDVRNVVQSFNPIHTGNAS